MSKLLNSILVLSLLLVVLAMSASAVTTITTCAYTISSAGEYDMSGSLSCNQGITINVDNVLVDCKGFGYTGTSETTGHGIRSAFGNYKNVTIKNCVLSNSDNPLDVRSGGLVENVTASKTTCNGGGSVNIFRQSGEDLLIVADSNFTRGTAGCPIVILDDFSDERKHLYFTSMDGFDFYNSFDNSSGMVSPAVERAWWINVNVTNTTGSPLSGVNVTFYDKTGYIVASVLTNSNGMIDRTAIPDGIFKPTSWPPAPISYTGYNNYSVYITKAGYTSQNLSRNISADTNYNFNMYLQPMPPNITLNKPLNNSFFANGNDITFNFSVIYGDYPVSNCSLWGNFNTNFTIIQKNVYYTCYQESSNTSNQTGKDGACALNYTGSYSFYNSSTISYLYINYTKPINASSDSYWTKKQGYYGITIYENTTIPSGCWNTYQDKLSFRLWARLSSNSGSGGECYNGTDWITLGSDSIEGSGGSHGCGSPANNNLIDGDWSTSGSNVGSDCGVAFTLDTEVPSRVFEEAMTWKINQPLLNNTIYNFEKTNLNDGTYIWNTQCTDINGTSSFALSNYSLIIDTTPPSITLTLPLNNSINSWTVLLRSTVTDSIISVNSTWYEIRNGTISSPIIASGTMNNIGSNIYNATFATNATWPYDSTVYNYTNLTLVVYANDTLGNTINASTYWTLDNSNPGIQHINPTDIGLITGYNFNLNIYLSNFKLNYSQYNITNSSGAVVQTNQSNLSTSTFFWTDLVNIYNYPIGNYTITTYTKDSQNFSRTKTTWFYVDKSAPTINIISPSNNTVYIAPNGTQVNFTCNMSTYSLLSNISIDIWNYSIPYNYPSSWIYPNASYLYQENANSTNISYSDGSILFNYTIPQHIDSAIWRVKHGLANTSSFFFNSTNPCWNASGSNKLSFKAISLPQQSYLYCRNNTDWQLLESISTATYGFTNFADTSSYAYDGNWETSTTFNTGNWWTPNFGISFYEEAVYWYYPRTGDYHNISGTSNSSLWAINLPKGEYSWKCSGYDINGNQATSSTYKLSIISNTAPTTPSITTDKSSYDKTELVKINCTNSTDAQLDPINYTIIANNNILLSDPTGYYQWNVSTLSSQYVNIYCSATDGIDFSANATKQIFLTGDNNQGSNIDNSSNLTNTNSVNSNITTSTLNNVNVTTSTIINSQVNNSILTDSSSTNSNIINSTIVTSTSNNSNILTSTTTNSTIVYSNLTNTISSNSLIINSSSTNSNITNSTLTISSSSNSNVVTSIIYNSNLNTTIITNSTITNSNITNSTVVNSNISNMIVNNANITDNFIYSGSIIYNGYTFQAPLPLSVIYQYQPSIMVSSRITPTNVSKTENLLGLCNATQTYFNITYSYSWFKNGVQNTTGTSATFIPGTEQNINNFTSSKAAGDQFILQCRAYDGVAYSSWTNSSIVTISSYPPSSLIISPISPVTLISGNSKNVVVSFNVSNRDENLNVSSSNLSISKSGTSLSSNNCSLDSIGFQWSKINCSIAIPYYSLPGTWTATASISDNALNFISNTSSFIINSLDSISVNVSSIDFGTASPGQTGVSGSILSISNLGNTDYNLMEMTAYDLNASTNLLAANNFCINDIQSTIGCDYMQNATAKSISGASLPINSNSSLYPFVNLPVGLTYHIYGASQQWILAVS